MKLLITLLTLFSLNLNAGLPPLPSPVGQTGKFLTNDGSKPLWGNFTVLGAPGSVHIVGTLACPSGTLLADGSAISRSTYSALFAQYGTTYGVGDGSTTFNLPDMRGIFIRGAGSQTISSILYSGTLGAKQGDQLQGHQHSFQTSSQGFASIAARGNDASISTQNTNTIISDGTNGTPRTGSETRPANIAMTYCIVTDSVPYTAISSLIDPVVSNITATNIDWALIKSNTGLYKKTLSANTTFTFSNLTAGQAINVLLTNTASNYTVTWPTVKWAGGTTPTMTTGAKSDIYSFFYDGTNIYGTYVQNF